MWALGGYWPPKASGFVRLFQPHRSTRPVHYAGSKSFRRDYSGIRSKFPVSPKSPERCFSAMPRNDPTETVRSIPGSQYQTGQAGPRRHDQARAMLSEIDGSFGKLSCGVVRITRRGQSATSFNLSPSPDGRRDRGRPSRGTWPRPRAALMPAI